MKNSKLYTISFLRNFVKARSYFVPLIILSLTLAFTFLLSNYASAIPEPGPAPGSTTLEKYCSNGTCISSSAYPSVNATTGQYAVGNYPNGIDINNSNLIGIQLSQSCISLERNHIQSDCLGYDKLKVFDNLQYLNNNQWVNDTWYHRTNSRLSNSWIKADQTYHVMVDPPTSYTAAARMIIVQSGNFTWINPDDNASNTKLIQHLNRFVTSCQTATVAPDLWLIKDTIRYFENGCTETAFNDTQIIHRTETAFSFNNPFSSLHYVQYIKSMDKFGFINTNQTGGHGLPDCRYNKCDYTDPYANHDHNFGW